MGDWALGGSQKAFNSAVTSSLGVTVTASASADTKGSYAELIASTESAASGLSVTLTSQSITAANTEGLLDIAVGSAGNEEVILADFHMSIDTADGNQAIVIIPLPIAVPSGTRISARWQTASTEADTFTCIANLKSPTFESHPGYGKIVSLGQNTGTSLGTAVDAGTTVNTPGTKVEFAATSEHFSGFFLSIGGNGDTATEDANFVFRVLTGSSGNEEVLVGGIAAKSASGERWSFDCQFFNVEIPPARLTIDVQADTTNAGNRALSVVFHGVK